MKYNWEVTESSKSLWSEIGDEGVYIVEMLDESSKNPFLIRSAIEELVTRAFSHSAQNISESTTQIVFDWDSMNRTITATYTDDERLKDSLYVQKLTFSGLFLNFENYAIEERVVKLIDLAIQKLVRRYAVRLYKIDSILSKSNLKLVYTEFDSEVYTQYI